MNKLKAFFCLVVFLSVFSVVGNSQFVSASPDCSNSDQPQAMYSDDDVTIQCSYSGMIWAGILRNASLTNRTTQVNNYNKSGGNNQALTDFNKMPGTARTFDDGAKIKTYEGKTVTYYPKSTSTSTPTLQYPASSGTTQLWDKVRYLQ